ncbi:hypothetical protein ARMSODRAFT_1027424 [Armillaria solidipes]|uniref:Uncharacterized protein n=1 Tax=Armillaria solidipes TaxID=1076256 RepID=A0A2H3B4E3_9AGAR|nr:hypothetical protein ARMSODRAFT_1027424 [Armillaria solidipes]
MLSILNLKSKVGARCRRVVVVVLIFLFSSFSCRHGPFCRITRLFLSFSDLDNSESLTKTWKVPRAGTAPRESQLALQNLMVDTDNAKSKQGFKNLSKCMGDKLEKEKGRSIEELASPDFKSSHSIEIIRQRTEEKERS